MDKEVDWEEEIPADSEPLPSFQIPKIPSLQYILENYGWFILLGTILVLFIYKQFIKSFIENIQQEKELEKRKKFDAEVQSAYDERIRAARERAQQELEIKAVEARERLEEKKRKQLQEAMEKAGVADGHATKVSKGAPATCPDPQTFVTSLINSVPVVVFSKSYCPYCRKAKQALSTYRLADNLYKIVELDEREDCSKIQDVLLQMTGCRSVPRVFIAGKCIGGGDDTVAAQKDGRLEKMLKEAGAI